MHRRQAMKVQGGRVAKKNNWVNDFGDYHAWTQREIRLDRRGSAPGYRHLVTIAQLRAFLPLLPDWDDLTRGLDAIVLDGDTGAMGWHAPGIVAVCNWERDLWWHDASTSFVKDHAVLFDALDVEYEQRAGDSWHVRWTEPQARAFQLCHILPHEMGHHRDRMQGRDREERPAEAYALSVFDEILPAYADAFGV